MSKPSPARTPLSVLRKTIGLTYESIGRLLGYSAVWVQKIELGNSELSDTTALKISEQTEVSLEWLKAGDPAAPIVSIYGEPYTKEHFEAVQSKLQGKRSGAGELGDAALVVDNFIRGQMRFTASMLSAMRKDKLYLFLYRLKQNNDAMAKEFGTAQDVRAAADLHQEMNSAISPLLNDPLAYFALMEVYTEQIQAELRKVVMTQLYSSHIECADPSEPHRWKPGQEPIPPAPVKKPKKKTALERANGNLVLAEHLREREVTAFIQQVTRRADPKPPASSSKSSASRRKAK